MSYSSLGDESVIKMKQDGGMEIDGGGVGFGEEREVFGGGGTSLKGEEAVEAVEAGEMDGASEMSGYSAAAGSTNKAGGAICENEVGNGASGTSGARGATGAFESFVSNGELSTSKANVEIEGNREPSTSLSPFQTSKQEEAGEKISSSNSKVDVDAKKEPSLIPITTEASLGHSLHEEDKDSSKISAYARLDFENFTFFVQTLQVMLGRKSHVEMIHSSHHAVDVHLGSKKAISRRHAKIFYNFGTQRFELSVIGRNGAFVDDMFIEKGITVPLIDGTKIQIGDIPFAFVLPSLDLQSGEEMDSKKLKPFNPSDAINLRSNLYNSKPALTKFSASRSNDKPSAKTSSEKSKKPASSISEAEVNGKRKVSASKSFSSRRRSSLRKKSLTSATNDEIDKILSELGDNSVAVVDEEDSEFSDSQIESLLTEHGDSNKTLEANDEALFKLAQFNQSAEGTPNADSSTAIKGDDPKKESDDRNKSELDDKGTGDIDLDLLILDQEIATLAPLIDAHHKELMKEKEEKRYRLEQEKRKQDMDNLAKMPQMREKYGDTNSAQQQRTTPLMGKPAAAAPRMGRPASIQPPASRLYNRSNNSNSKNSSDKLSTSSGVMGLPTHLVAHETSDSGLALRLAQGTHHSMAHLISDPIPRGGYVPQRPPAPKLKVAIETLTINDENKLTSNRRRAITTNRKMKLPSVCDTSNISENSSAIKLQRKKKEPTTVKKITKNIYTIDEIPEHYRTKPSISYSLMIMNTLKARNGGEGLTLSEINETIKDMYPFYKYCHDGWQFPISHNLALNKIFKRKFKRDDTLEWVWTVDESYIAERERIRKKQQDFAAAKAKAAALKVEEIKQQQRLEAQQAATNIIGRNLVSHYGVSSMSNPLQLPQTQLLSQLHRKHTNFSGGDKKPKTIAELASEIRRDGIVGSKAPLYFKPHPSPESTPSPHNNEVTSFKNLPPKDSGSTQLGTLGTPNTIRDQLAANRSISPSPSSRDQIHASAESSVISQSDSGHDKPPRLKMNLDTKKSLTYLQKELFNLYKVRKLSYNTATTTEVITKALATTIAQVNAIGAKAGCGDNALSFLVEKAPQQVSKILDIALSKAIREKQESLSSKPYSNTSNTSSPMPQNRGSDRDSESGLRQSRGSTPQLSAPETGNESRRGATAPSSSVTRNVPGSSHPVGASDNYTKFSSSSPPLLKPPLFMSGLTRKPPFIGKEQPITLLASAGSTAAPGSSYSGLSKPQSFSKLGTLSRPSLFLTNKSVKLPITTKREASATLVATSSPEIVEEVPHDSLHHSDIKTNQVKVSLTENNAVNNGLKRKIEDDTTETDKSYKRPGK